MASVFKSRKLLGHPAHAPLTHFPMALWSAAFVADLLWGNGGDGFWWRGGFYALAAGCGMGSLALATGLFDLLGIPADGTPWKKALWHMGVMGAASILFWMDLYWHRPSLVPGGSSWGPAWTSGAGVLLLQVGGWLGGELVYRHGIGYHGGSSSLKD